MKTSIIDTPLNGKTEPDLFDIKGYQDALVEFIKYAEAPLTIALQGEWGSGKTSLMNVLKTELTQESARYYAIEVNTWHYSMLCTPDQAIVGILRSILEQMGKKEQSKSNVFKAISGKLATFAATASVNILGQLVAVPEVGSSILEAYKSCKNGSQGLAISDILPASSIVEELKSDIQKAIGEIFPVSSNDQNGKKGFLFFIDDLDRIDPPVAVKILELLKNIFDLPRCIFVLAIDYDVVVKGLKPKFGELTPQNEREFRSFFDKIIQVPFSMPMSSYKIDKFLTEKLKVIGFLSNTEINNAELTTTLSEFAHWSVGCNPRSLKRLTNTLSLIRLITDKTRNEQDNSDFKDYKALNFALVCIQNTYPAIYNALLIEPDFREWDDEIVQKFALPELPKDVQERLKDNEEFNEPWELILFRICNNDHFLSQRALEISNMLNKIIKIIPEGKNLGDCLSKVMRLSSVTNVQAAEQQKDSINADFHKSTWLKAYRDRILPAVNGILGDSGSVISTNSRVKTVLYLRYQRDNEPIVENIQISFSYSESQRKFTVHIDKGFSVFQGSTTTDWTVAEQEIGQLGTWDKIKDSFCDLKNKYHADHDISKSLNIGCGGSYVWFALHYTSLEEIISDKSINEHAQFLSEFFKTAAEFKKLENSKLFKEYFYGLKNHCSSHGYVPFTKLWIHSWHTLVIDRFLYKNSILSLDMTFEQNGFMAQFWVREGDQSVLEDVLDKANLRNEFTDVVNERHVKHLQYADAQGFVDKMFTALQNYIQE